MKVLLFVVFLSLALGALAQIGESEPQAEPENLNVRIHRLQALVNKLEGSVKRFTRIGKSNVAKLESVMNAVSERRRRCLVLETLRPAPIPYQPLPDIPQPVGPTSAPLSLSQISARIQGLERTVGKIEAATDRYVGIGRGNIGLMQRFAEASRTSVCGADHYSKCPMGFIHNAVSDSCFREVVGQLKTFTEAQVACHRRGGHLPRVENVEKNNALADLLQTLHGPAPGPGSIHALWLGLRRTDAGAWHWVHPEDNPVPLGDYTNFKTAEEDDALSCAYLCTRSNSWIRASCDTQKRVLCEKPINAPAAVAAK